MKWSKQELDSVVEYAKLGKTYKEISVVLGRSNRSIQEKLIDLNYNSKKYTKFIIEVKCDNCGIVFNKKKSAITNHNFCSQSCSTTYNNKHKTRGNRRSKLEHYIENQLKILYPDLVFLFNDKSTINSELDIYIPSLHLAFELNGIYHFEPIHGQDKLDKIVNNDNRKFAACNEAGISLCIIDTSAQKHFTEKSSQKYLDVVLKIIRGCVSNT